MSLVPIKFDMDSKWIHAKWVYNTQNQHVIINAWSTLTTWKQTVKSSENLFNEFMKNWSIEGNIFKKDAEFNSPSAAANLLVWRNETWPWSFIIEGTNYPLKRVSYITSVLDSIKWLNSKHKHPVPEVLDEQLIKWFLRSIWENTDNPTRDNLLNAVRRINDDYDISDEIKNISDEKLDEAIRITANYNGYIWWWKKKWEIGQPKLISQSHFTWTNILYYWVPWCGKSYSVKKDIEKEWYIYRRILFHPEYSYADFVWQILPIKKWDDIVYDFVAWPFTTILCDALKDPENKYCLVIEEINRWNASAIFWDIFQLLDRERSWDNQWESEYWIQNEWISSYLAKEWLWISEIKIPSNLSLIATMNSSDQNVFVLDTAFKRRWNFKKISNEFSPNHPFKDVEIEWTGITWENFVITINNEISGLSKYWINWDDKQIWLFFVSREDLESREQFAEKILLYLWDDVVKFNKTLLFKEEYNSIDKLIKWFTQSGFEVFKDWIFA